MDAIKFYERIKKEARSFNSVISFNEKTDKFLLMDFTKGNGLWTENIINNEQLFNKAVKKVLEDNNATFGIGGYNELRTVYAMSEVFGKENEEPRRLHLGIDIWGDAGTKVYAPLNGKIHSFAFNEQKGDYGATIILQHQLLDISFYTLYGHLALKDLDNLKEGNTTNAGQAFAHFGDMEENGHWPPHLHFQIILNMDGMKGDYPGVCKLSEQEKYLSNCPNPDLILRLMHFAK
jgi:murein DD-endopeptidase MepM/ murein hydrolase activator NlpD